MNYSSLHRQADQLCKKLFVKKLVLKMKIFSYFMDNTNLHGFKYFVIDKKAPLWKRMFATIFWSFFMTLSVFLLVYLLKEKFLSKDSSSTSINVDTSYRDWNNSFPAVSICFDKGLDFKPIQDYVENYFRENDIKQPKRATRYFRNMRDM